MHVIYAFCPKPRREYVTYDENVKIERMEDAAKRIEPRCIKQVSAPYGHPVT